MVNQMSRLKIRLWPNSYLAPIYVRKWLSLKQLPFTASWAILIHLQTTDRLIIIHPVPIHATGLNMLDLQLALVSQNRRNRGGAAAQLEWSQKSVQRHRSMPRIPEVSPGEHLSCGLILDREEWYKHGTHTNMIWRGPGCAITGGVYRVWESGGIQICNAD